MAEAAEEAGEEATGVLYCPYQMIIAYSQNATTHLADDVVLVLMELLADIDMAEVVLVVVPLTELPESVSEPDPVVVTAPVDSPDVDAVELRHASEEPAWIYKKSATSRMRGAVLSFWTDGEGRRVGDGTGRVGKFECEVSTFGRQSTITSRNSRATY